MADPTTRPYRFHGSHWPAKVKQQSDEHLWSGDSPPGMLPITMAELTRLARNYKIDEDKAMRLPAYGGGVSLISGAVIQLPLRVVDKDTRPVTRMPPWATANPCPGMSAAAWIQVTMDSQLIYGTTVYLIHSWLNGRPWRLEPLPGRTVTLYRMGRGKRRKVTYTDYTGGASYQMVEWLGPGDDEPGPDNRCLIVHNRETGLVNGRSTLGDLASTVALGLAMMDHAGLTFSHPGFQAVLYPDGAAGNEAQINSVARMMKQIKEKMETPDHRNLPVVTGAKVGVAHMGYSAEQQQLIPAQNQVVEQVCRRLGIPPPLLALPVTTWGTGHTSMRRSLFQVTIPAWTTPVLSALDRLLPPGQHAIFDMTKALKSEMESEAGPITKLAGGATWSLNEARAYQNLPPVDGGDEIRGQSDMSNMPQEVEVV